MLDKTLAIILAGGVGSRLHPLTADRAKPAVPFGGQLPDHRLHADELSTLRVATCAGADSIQVPLTAKASARWLGHLQPGNLRIHHACSPTDANR